MANNTDTYWSVDGQSLHTFAHSIETLGGLLKASSLRGEDITIPNQPGKVWVPKIADSRILSLSMWVRGIVNGAAKDGQDTRSQFQTNWNNIVRLLWREAEQFNLTKRFYDGSSSIISATARAEFSNGLEPTMQGRNAAKFVVDLNLSDPFFYADTPLSVPLANGDNNIIVPGNAKTNRILVSISGARSNLKIRNKTTGVELTYAGVIPSGTEVSIDVKTYEARETPSGGSTFKSNGKVGHSGAPQWLNLKHGANIINLSSSAGAGEVSLQVRGAWV